MTLEELTDQLAAIYRSGQKYRFVEQAHRVLSGVPAAPKLVELTLRALLELGLGGPARELVQLRTEFRDDDNLCPEVEAALAKAPNGRLRWAERNEVFRRNVAALLLHRPHLQPLVDSLPQLLAGVHLYCTSEGHHHISRRRPGQLREWLPGLTREDGESPMELPSREQLGPPAVIGLRISPVLERLYQDTQHLMLSYSHPIYIVEPDPVRFAVWLHCADHGPLLNDERVYYFIGGNAVSELTELLIANPNLPLPQLSVNQFGTTLGETTSKQVRAAIEQVARQREAELVRYAAKLEQRYQERDATYWADRFQPPGMVLGVTSRFTTVLQYSMRDTLHALGEMGYEPHMLIEAKDHYQYSQLDICRKILELDPIMVILLDHLRYESPHMPKNLPMLTWIQDPMANLLCRQAGESIGTFDFVCGHFGPPCIAEFGYPADRFVNINIPVSDRVFHDGEPDAEIMARYACDVCFVSNASEPIDRFYESAVPMYPPEYHPLLRLIYERALSILDRDEHPEMGTAAKELVRTAATDISLSLEPSDARHISTHFAYRLLDWGRRQQTLEWVAAWARRTNRVLRIYGRGWEKHPTLAEFAAGAIEHGEPLRRATRAAKLALQLIPAGFRHQRALEILASGTLPLARYCSVDFADLPIETFVPQREAGLHPTAIATIFPGLERVMFRTPEEFEALAERYLADEHQRQQVLTDLRRVALRDYTYTGTMKKVMTPFREVVAREAELQAEKERAPAATGA